VLDQIIRFESAGLGVWDEIASRYAINVSGRLEVCTGGGGGGVHFVGREKSIYGVVVRGNEVVNSALGE
jgi:hypothetical protein